MTVYYLGNLVTVKMWSDFDYPLNYIEFNYIETHHSLVVAWLQVSKLKPNEWEPVTWLYDSCSLNETISVSVF